MILNPFKLKFCSVKDNDVEDDALYHLHFQKGHAKLQELKKIKTLFSNIVKWRY